MERLNYHHLLYFYTVAREGSVARASSRLGLKQPTVSAQIHALEKELGSTLLERSGRGLKVTAAGNTVLQYAEKIFAIGGELRSALTGQADETAKLIVGVSSSVPRVLVEMLLKKLFALKPAPVLTVVEGDAEQLTAAYASRGLQFVLTDAKRPGTGEMLQSGAMLESELVGFAPQALARELRKDFAKRAEVPVVLPAGGTLRVEAESWIARHKQPISKVAEVRDPEEFAAAAGAVVFGPLLLRELLKNSYGLLPIGELKGSHWRLSVVSPKGFKNPGLNAVMRAARELR